MEENYYDYYLRYISAAGLDRPNTSWSRTKKYSYYLIRTFCFACIFFATIFGLADVILKEEFNVNTISSNLIDISIYINCLFRLTYTVVNSQKLHDIIDKINGFKRSTANGRDIITMADSAKVVRKVLVYWVIFAMGCIFCIDQSTIYAAIFFEERKLVTPMYTFYDHQKFPNYEFTVFYEILTQLLHAYIYINLDIFFFTTVVLINKQIDILAYDLRTAMYVPKLEGEMQDVTNIISEGAKGGTLRCGKSLDETLAKCIRHHQQLLDAIRKLEAFLSFPSFLQCIFSTTYIMLSLFLIVISDDKADAINAASYLYGSFVQICFMSIFGQMLTDKLEILSQAVYEMPWYLEGRKTFSLIILILQMKFGQPVKISAGKFFDLTHATFLAIVHTSFTYFTVLREVTGN